MLAERPCILRDEDHRYVDLTTGTEMVTSVTAVINYFRPPYDGPPEAGPRGNHVHRYLEARLKGLELPGPISPEGIDCSGWFDQIQGLKLFDREIIASEFTMVNARLGLGGQIDCIFRDSRGLVTLLDLKTKGAHWTSPKPQDIKDYKAQAGGYIHLLTAPESTAESRIWIDTCVTLVVTPKKVTYLPPYTPDECCAIWRDCWERYFVAARMSF